MFGSINYKVMKSNHAQMKFNPKLEGIWNGSASTGSFLLLFCCGKCHFCQLKKAAPLFEDIFVLYIFYCCLYIVKHFEHM